MYDILLSEDENLLESNKWMFDDLQNSKFLQKDSKRTVGSTGNIVCYSSFPRSGNSFLRKYFENITGVVTGSEMSLEFNVDLQLMNFKGEEITDESVWIKKSHDPKFISIHDPEFISSVKTHKCNKIIVCVRNPYDVIASLMNFFPILC